MFMLSGVYLGKKKIIEFVMFSYNCLVFVSEFLSFTHLMILVKMITSTFKVLLLHDKFAE